MNQSQGSADANVTRPNNPPVTARLIELNVDQAKDLPYPHGSLVWYKLDQSMAAGIVKSISFEHSSKSLFYEVQSIGSAFTDLFPQEDMIGFGAGCPVQITMTSSTNSSYWRVDGNILYSKVNEKNHEVVSYAVMIYSDSSRKRFLVEDNVAPNRVKFNNVEEIEVACNDEDPMQGINEVVGMDVEKNIDNNINIGVQSTATGCAGVRSCNSEHPGSELQLQRCTSVLTDEETSSLRSSNTCSQGETSLHIPSPSVDENQDDKTTNRVQTENNETQDLNNMKHQERETGLSSQKRLLEDVNGLTNGSNDTKRQKHMTQKYHIPIPSWLLGKEDESRQKLVDHLVNDDVLMKNQCIPMKTGGNKDEIHLTTTTTERNMKIARTLLQNSLLTFTGNDGCKGKLLFDLEVSKGIDVHPMSNGSSVARMSTRDGPKVWASVIDLPCTEEEGDQEYLKKELTSRMFKKSTGCHVEMYGKPYSSGPLKLCDPYILLFSQSLEDVKLAYDILVKEITKSWRR